MAARYDVFIAGGGLAGLTLARQLTRELPALRVLIAEKRHHPVPEAAFKVGESTVEIAAHYFHDRLGLGEHIRERHLEKLGLRYFFPSPDNRRIDDRFELGPSAFPPVPSFQFDRGRFENALLRANRGAGVDVRDGVRVVRIEPGDPHRINLDEHGRVSRVEARWIVDASGRSGLLRRQFGLDRPVGHTAGAAWFRVRARVRLDDWSDGAAWRGRVPSGERWLSTNHLMGRGYWVWLIPLGSGSTSIGIVADQRVHDHGRINRFARALDWLRAFEPQCADVVEGHRGDVEDFLALRHFAYGCTRVFSADRWALVGEAGPFTDPFYSPGSDFIAVGNDYTVDLIRREQRGESIRPIADRYDAAYRRLYDAFLRLYAGQYDMMGDAQVMTAKIAWDNACYWSVTALLFFQRRLADPAFIASIDPLLRRFFVLHARMQQLLRVWHAGEDPVYYTGFASVFGLEWLQRLQAQLAGPAMDAGTLGERLRTNLQQLERFAGAILRLARERHADRPELDRLLPAEVAAAPDIDIAPFRLRL